MLTTVEPITRIMLDLDDVLNTFTVHAMRFLGCPSCEYPIECGYNLMAAINLKHPTINNWVPEQVWGMLGDTFWEDMPISDIYSIVLEYCVDIVGKDQVFICSTLTSNISCTSGKLRWIRRHLPDWIQNQYVLTSKKSLFANQHTLLIDDHYNNTLAFEKEGGSTILVPRPWNPYNCYDTEPFVKKALDYIRNIQR